MWLPKDERNLLVGYYSLLGGIDAEKWYDTSIISRLLSGKRCTQIPEYGELDPEGEVERGSSDNAAEIKKYLTESPRVRVANTILSERGLIMITPHQHEPDVFGVKLTVKGYDLGRALNVWFTRSGIWFREYKDHWLWLIMAFFGGAICDQLLEAIFKKK